MVTGHLIVNSSTLEKPVDPVECECPVILRAVHPRRAPEGATTSLKDDPRLPDECCAIILVRGQKDPQ